MSEKTRRRERQRDYGIFIPIAEVSLYLYGGWRILDQLLDDPAGRDVILMRWPPHEDRRAA